MRYPIGLMTLLALLSAACAPPSSESSGTDAAAAERYLVMGSYIAEIVVALGAADQVVGVSDGTGHISELAGVPVIPGFRSLSAETMLSLGPTVALVGASQSRPEIISQLEAAGVVVHSFPENIVSLDVVPDRIREIGARLGKSAEAEQLVAEFEAELAAALRFAGRATTRPRGLFILSGGGRPTLVAGADTHIALLIELAGGDNVTDGIEYFKPMSQEAMLAAAPEFFLVNQDGLELSGGVPVALSAPGALLTPAGRDNNVIALPGGYLQGLGLNSPKAIKALAEQLHPELGPAG